MDSIVMQGYERTRTDPVLRKVFDFDTFLQTTGMEELLLGFGIKDNTRRYDLRVVNKVVEALIKYAIKPLEDSNVPLGTSQLASSEMVNGGASRWPALLFDICFEQGFATYLLNEFRQSFNNTSVSQLSYIKSRVQTLVENINVVKGLFDNDASVITAAVTAMSSSHFMFGESLYVQTAEFDVVKFQATVAPVIARVFKPYFYFRYLLKKYSECNLDVECLRTFSLAAMVYIYYFTMSIFLIVYSTRERTQEYKTATNKDDMSISESRRLMVFLMDNILAIIGNDTKGSGDVAGEVGKLYNTVKRMSLSNVQTSNNVVKMQQDIVVLQNNLSNYNAMESVTARQYYRTKVWFYISLVFWLGMIAYMIGLTMLQYHFFADILTLISIVACVALGVYIVSL